MTQAVTPAENKQNLLKELGDSYSELQAALEGLSDEQLTEVWLGSWGAREMLLHIIGWQREMIGALERIGRGERPTPEGVDYGDADAWNDQFVRAARQRPVAQVSRDLRDTYGEYLRAVEALPEDRFAPGRTVDRLLHSSGIDHFREHAAQIRQWRQRQGL